MGTNPLLLENSNSSVELKPHDILIGSELCSSTATVAAGPGDIATTSTAVTTAADSNTEISLISNNLSQMVLDFLQVEIEVESLPSPSVTGVSPSDTNNMRTDVMDVMRSNAMDYVTSRDVRCSTCSEDSDIDDNDLDYKRRSAILFKLEARSLNEAGFQTDKQEAIQEEDLEALRDLLSEINNWEENETLNSRIPSFPGTRNDG